jgi:uncharacterized protein DUF5666
MRKLTALLLLLIAATAFAHAGHVHKYLGTITAIHDDQVVIHTTDGKDVTFVVTTATAFKRGDADAKRADMTKGTRVSVELALDGKSATLVKLGNAS